MLKLVKSLYAAAIWHFGGLAAWRRIHTDTAAVGVLGYHRIEGRMLDEQLTSLKRHFRFVTLDDVWLHITGRSQLGDDCLVLTFDDGHESFCNGIYPVLLRHNCPATMFVTTGAVDNGGLLWFDKVRLAVAAGGKSLRIGDFTVPLRDRRIAYGIAIQCLRTMPSQQRAQIVDDLFRAASPSDQDQQPHRMMTWDMIRRIRGLVTFGAHTVTHPDLSTLGDEEAMQEITGSKDRIETELQEPVKFFAYPFGDRTSFTERTAGLVARAGLQMGFTTIRGRCSNGDAPHALPRILADGSFTGKVLTARVSGLWLFLST